MSTFSFKKDLKLNNLACNSLKIPSGLTNPSVVPSDGFLFFNITDGSLYISKNGVWAENASSSSSHTTFNVYGSNLIVSEGSLVIYSDTDSNNTNNDGMYNPGTGIFTVLTTGFYLITTNNQVTVPDSTGIFSIGVSIDGGSSVFPGTEKTYIANNSGGDRLDQYNASMVIRLTAGDEVCVVANNNNNDVTFDGNFGSISF